LFVYRKKNIFLKWKVHSFRFLSLKRIIIENLLEIIFYFGVKNKFLFHFFLIFFYKKHYKIISFFSKTNLKQTHPISVQSYSYRSFWVPTRVKDFMKFQKYPRRFADLEIARHFWVTAMAFTDTSQSWILRLIFLWASASLVLANERSLCMHYFPFLHFFQISVASCFHLKL
jgi:hypothetical protein